MMVVVVVVAQEVEWVEICVWYACHVTSCVRFFPKSLVRALK